MAHLNPQFEKLPKSYIFPVIEEKLANLHASEPEAEILNLGVGDVSLPLLPEIAEAISKAAHEMTHTPRGYGPSEGYSFLREAICTHEYAEWGLTPEEIFISDGTNADASSIGELFSPENIVAIADPTYPVYLDASLIGGKHAILFPTTEADGFIPHPPKERAELVYLCTPCNPTGVALNEAHLAEWIAWAKKNGSLLLIDNVYFPFAQAENIPSSIYALEGAKDVAIEMRSFSKLAGFTGLRCGYMAIPKAIFDGKLHQMWARRTAAKSNGVSYPIQRGAEVCFEPAVRAKLKEQIAIYQNSARLLRHALREGDQTFFGGENSPYIFWKTPEGVSSWEFFDELLETCKIVAIPGSGFGPCGEGYIRLSCFLPEETATKAAHALHHLFATV